MIKYLTYEELENARIMYQNFLNAIGPNPMEILPDEMISCDILIKRKILYRRNLIHGYFGLMHWLGLCQESVDTINTKFGYILPPVPIEYDQIPIGSEIYIPGYKNAW